MRRYFTILFAVMMTLHVVVPLDAKIVEVHNLEQLYHHLTPGTLVVLDIDNTLVEPVQELGSSQWLRHQIKEYQNHGFDHEEALDRVIPLWIAIQNMTQVKLVEKETAEIIIDLQNKGIPLMGLTTRGLSLATCTARQLRSLGIDLTKTSPSNNEIYFRNTQGVLFRDGIFFTALTHKGKAFQNLLAKMKYTPKRILFINDIGAHLRELEEVCKELKIPFVGLRYGHLDEKVKNFRKQVADIQLYYFGRIMSDEAAERILYDSK